MPSVSKYVTVLVTMQTDGTNYQESACLVASREVPVAFDAWLPIQTLVQPLPSLAD